MPSRNFNLFFCMYVDCVTGITSSSCWVNSANYRRERKRERG